MVGCCIAAEHFRCGVVGELSAGPLDKTLLREVQGIFAPVKNLGLVHLEDGVEDN